MISGRAFFLNDSEHFRMQEIAQVFAFADALADEGGTDFEEGSLYHPDMRRKRSGIL